MFMLWILLYIIGFAVTTIGIKFFDVAAELDGDWWLAVFLWPLFVPVALCVMFITKVASTTGSWWDRVSDELVEKLRELGSRNSAE